MSGSGARASEAGASGARSSGGLECVILEVDLGSGQAFTYPVPDDQLRLFLGGSGLNAVLLYQLTDPGTASEADDSPIIFGAGPCVGTMLPACSRTTLTFRSPLTGCYGDTNAGGDFGARFRRLGYSHLIIRGKSARWVYLFIGPDGQCEIHDAERFLGMDISLADAEIRKHHPGSTVARIGPAGEHDVKFACVACSSKRPGFFGRTGAGALFGSKKLKAIVLQDTQKRVSVADERHLASLSSALLEMIKSNQGAQDRAKNGTHNLMTAYNSIGDLWQQNYSRPVPQELGQGLEPEAFLSRYYSGRGGCWRCPLACSLKWENKETGESGTKVEFGHTFPLGVNLGIFDFGAVLRLSNMANELGMDSMELGYVMGFTAEACQRGILTEGDIGHPVRFGVVEDFVQLAGEIAYRKGIGQILAEGVKGASKNLGPAAAEFAFHMKGQAYRVERNLSWTLGFVVSPRGGDHLKSFPFTTFIYGTPFAMDACWGKSPQAEAYEMESPVGKGRSVWWHENFKTVIDSLGLCIFPYINLKLSGQVGLDELADIFRITTGLSMSGSSLFQAGERIFQIFRAFNARLGIRAKDDDLVRRPKGSPGFPYSVIDLKHPGMLPEYYHYRGCSEEGLPKISRLRELGLDWVASDLERYGAVAP
ncbi:MAG: aldehyde ferredoxin oxidoreductase C-terminal domain-containing protein [bacterium]